MLDDAPDAVRRVFETVAASAPEIRAGLPGRRVKTDEENVSGEQVMAADRWADELLGDRLGSVDGVGEYASEERDGVADTARSAPNSRAEPGDSAERRSAGSRTESGDTGDGLSVAVDPLDGSSNLKSNNPMGTVVGVYDGALPTNGRDLVAAGFVLYGPITTMVVAHDGAPTEYVVEDGEPRDVGTVELPDDPTVYGFGGRVPDWPDDFAAYVEAVERELKLRYGGAMIADVSQVLTYGGVFAYPGLQSRPEGKLRLLFEGAPIAYIVEAAGGASSDGTQSLLDVEAESVHQRVPVHVGNEELIERLERALGG